MCLFECVPTIMLDVGRRRNPEPPLNINTLPCSLICVSTLTKNSENAGNVPFGRWARSAHSEMIASCTSRGSSPKFPNSNPPTQIFRRKAINRSPLWMHGEQTQGLWNPGRALPSTGPFSTTPPWKGERTSTLLLQVAFFLGNCTLDVYTACVVFEKIGLYFKSPLFLCGDNFFLGSI